MVLPRFLKKIYEGDAHQRADGHVNKLADRKIPSFMRLRRVGDHRRREMAV